MKQMTIISGKGGAGKTTIAASLLSFPAAPLIVDCDVDASNLHLLLGPRIIEREEFFGLDVARSDPGKCIGCGKCRDVCRFGAIDAEFEVKEDRCEGCAVCTLVCPSGALEMVPRMSGESYVSATRFGPLVHARLFPGEEASGKLVSRVRTRALETARAQEREIIIIDGPPGSGCEVIASITGVDLVLLVIEPTLSGIHDAKRVLELCRHFRIDVVACVNKYDINPDLASDIEEYLDQNGVKVLGRLPYDDEVTASMLRRETLMESGSDEIKGIIGNIWRGISNSLMKGGN
ncbi:MAG: ATP-binding protein [Thermoplasmatota archaeon]